MQIILPGIAEVDVNLCNFGFRLFPVLAELYFPREAALIAFQPLLLFFLAIERVEVAAVAEGDETGNAHIQPHDAARGLFCFHFAAGLNRRKPLAAGLADCHVADFA